MQIKQFAKRFNVSRLRTKAYRMGLINDDKNNKTLKQSQTIKIKTSNEATHQISR